MKKEEEEEEGPEAQAHPFRSKHCSDAMTFEECELAILRHAVDKSDNRRKFKTAQDPLVRSMIVLVENFLREHKDACLCYGGTAINNLLPVSKRFYDPTIDVPDYDVFTIDAVGMAKKMAQRFYDEGYTEVEAKAGVHFGTYKVFVNFLPVADWTAMHPALFVALQDDALEIEGVRYAPPNFLRMSMFVELSRPQGNVARWEKVFKRMSLLNDAYPMKVPTLCRSLTVPKPVAPNVLQTVRDVLIRRQVVFFGGGFALSLYEDYLDPRKKVEEPNESKQTKPKQTKQKEKKKKKKKKEKEKKEKKRLFTDFDVLSHDLRGTADAVKHALPSSLDVALVYHTAVDEIVPEHIEVLVNEVALVTVYRPLSCHAYNKTMVDGQLVRVATIDTMMSFYLAFLYSKKVHLQPARILCMAATLFKIQQKNRLAQKGLLKRYVLNCFGRNQSMEDIRAEKAHRYEHLRSRRHSKAFEQWFLQYRPQQRYTRKKQRLGTKKPNEGKEKEKEKGKPLLHRKSPLYSQTRRLDTSPVMSLGFSDWDNDDDDDDEEEE